MRLLRQSTASQEQVIGPFIDDTDGKTRETALTIANTDIKLVKGGSTSEVNKNSGGGTHISQGRYSIAFDATDTNTLGSLFVAVDMTGTLPVWHEFEVISQSAYDALHGTGDGILSDIRASTNTDAVKAAVAAELATTTYAELGSVPAATSSLKDKITWMFMQARNKMTSNNTTQTLRNDADSSNVSTSTISESAGTFTRGEWS